MVSLLCLLKDIANAAALHDLEWQRIMFAQFIPERERAWWIVVEEKARP
jgi:hypothetical protein